MPVNAIEKSAFMGEFDLHMLIKIALYRDRNVILEIYTVSVYDQDAPEMILKQLKNPSTFYVRLWTMSLSTF